MAGVRYPQMVRIRNEDDKPFNAKYAGERYVVMPGQDTFIPWDAMCLWFGHPHAVDVPGDKRKRYRSDELRRLFVKYGIYENHHLAEEKFPKVTVWNITNGEQIITVVNDPDGKLITPQDMTKADNESLQAQLAALQEQMAIILAQQKQGQVVDPDADLQAFDPSNRPEIPSNVKPGPNPSDEGGTGSVDDIPQDGPLRPKVVAH